LLLFFGFFLYIFTSRNFFNKGYRGGGWKKSSPAFYPPFALMSMRFPPPPLPPPSIIPGEKNPGFFTALIDFFITFYAHYFPSLVCIYIYIYKYMCVCIHATPFFSGPWLFSTLPATAFRRSSSARQVSALSPPPGSPLWASLAHNAS